MTRWARIVAPAVDGLVGSGGSESTGSSIRTAASRARAPSCGTPFTLTSSSCTPVVQRQAGVGPAAQQHGQPDRQPVAGRELAGQRHELGLHGVGAGVAVQRVPDRALGAQRLPRCTRISRSDTGTLPVLVEHPDHGQGLRPGRGDQPRLELGELQRQRPGGDVGQGRRGGRGRTGERRRERQRRQHQHEDRDSGRDRSHAVSSSSSVARRISRRSSA